MLTEVHIKRIMTARKQFTGSAVAYCDYGLMEDIEIFEMLDEDTPISETNGLM